MNDTKTKKEVYQVCVECGISANVLTCLRKYGQRPKQLAFTMSTFHIGICDCCGEEKHVTEARDFFYPDFTLLQKVADYLRPRHHRPLGRPDSWGGDINKSDETTG